VAIQVQERWGDAPAPAQRLAGRSLGLVPPGADGGGVDELLVHTLTVLGLDAQSAAMWSEAIVAQATQDGGVHPSGQVDADASTVIGAMTAMARARCSLDATVLVCVQDLLLRTGEKLLAERGVGDVSTLSRTAHQTWRAHTKASVAGELQVALGVGVTEGRQLVAVASAPARVRRPVLDALRRGEVQWAEVRRFQARTSRLLAEDAADVAEVLFGTDPSRAAPERLDPDGVLTCRSWHRNEYYAALDREVTRVRGRDERGERQRRREALNLRDARLDVLDDGTATFSISGSVATMLALNGRIDGMARRCRKAGDTRTLAQLRADISASILLFGAVVLPGPDEDCDDIVTPDDLEALAAVVNATPAGHVELVVPWDALLGRAAHPSSCDRSGQAAGRAGPVGEIRGWPSAWVAPEEAREIALRPGSVFHRLLTDPADGRCLERSIARYAPDAEMRRQIRAADVYGRGPGCRRPATACELDHETPWGDGGATREGNLNAKSLLDHFRKTKRLWRSVMDERRNLTWTTLLGQVARTRGHDYRQYADAFDHRVGGGAGDRDGKDAPTAPPAQAFDVERSDLADRRDLANQVLYAALVMRRPGDRVAASDDVPGSEDWLCVGDWGSVSYRDDQGRRRFGAPPTPTSPEQLLGLVTEAAHGEEGEPRETDVLRSDRPEPPPF
jgi:hypothetical protein